MSTIVRAINETREFLRANVLFLYLILASLVVGFLLVNNFVPDYVVLLGLVAVPLVIAIQFAIIRDLSVGIVIFLLLEYLQLGYRIPFVSAIRPALLVSGALIAAWVVNLMRHRVPLVLNWQVKSYALLLGLGLMSALNAISVGMVGITLITFFKTLIVFTIMFSAVRTFEQLQRLTWLYIGLHVILAIGGFFLFVTGGERRFGDLGGSFLGDENDSAMAILIMIPYMFFMLQTKPRVRARLILMTGMILASLTVLFSFSRGAFIGFMTMVLYMWAKGTNKLKSGLIILGVVGLFFAIMPPEYWERIESVKGYATEGSAQGRLDAWKGGIQMMVDSPLLGCGIGNFSRAYGERYNTINARWTAAHSLYIEFIGQLGVPGLLFILGYILLTLRTFHFTRKITRQVEGKEARTLEKIMLGAECGFVTYLVTTVFLSSMNYPHLWHFGAMSGLGLIVAKSLAPPGAMTGPSGLAARGLTARGPRLAASPLSPSPPSRP
jgi:probable O-glycosylation ligase (exosortase A-associated)